MKKRAKVGDIPHFVHQIGIVMMSKSEMARRMKTSRAAVDRLLNPENESATLTTLEKAAYALGKRLLFALV